MTSSCECYHVAVESLADGVAVHLVGDLPDGESCLDGQGILDRVRQFGQTHLYVDCEGLKSLGHPGVSDLVRLGKVARGWGGRAVLCRVPPHVKEILTICRLDQVFDYRSEAAPGSKLRWIDVSWVSRNDGSVSRIAQDIHDKRTFDHLPNIRGWIIHLWGCCIHDKRTFDHLPNLADALEEAGCTNDDILSHCRGPGPHGRSCWVLDLILRKE
jgi:anti-anti-sigma factor